MTENTKATLRRFYEFFNTGDLTEVDSLFHPEFIDHSSDSVPLHGPEAFKDAVRRERIGLPDIEERPLALLLDGEWAASMYREKGTHLGEFMKMPASGKEIDFVGIEIFRLRDGKFAEWWYSNMWLETYRQLGWKLVVKNGKPGFERV